MRSDRISLRILVLLGASVMALAAAGAPATAGMSELDSYSQALTSASREDALGFIREFPESPLVDDLIESLPPVVAPQVCTDLNGAGPRLAQDACKRFQGPPAIAAAVIAAPIVPPAPAPLKLTDPSGTTGSVCDYESCKAAPAAPIGKPAEPAVNADRAGPSDTTAGASDATEAGGTSTASKPDKAIPGTDARIGGSLDASGAGTTLDETKAGDVSSTASGNVTGSVGDTRSGAVDGSLGANVGDTGNGNLDGSIGAAIGDPNRATVGGSVGGSVGGDSNGRGVDGDLRGGLKAKLLF